MDLTVAILLRTLQAVAAAVVLLVVGFGFGFGFGVVALVGTVLDPQHSVPAVSDPCIRFRIASEHITEECTTSILQQNLDTPTRSHSCP